MVCVSQMCVFVRVCVRARVFVFVCVRVRVCVLARNRVDGTCCGFSNMGYWFAGQVLSKKKNANEPVHTRSDASIITYVHMATLSVACTPETAQTSYYSTEFPDSTHVGKHHK